VVKGEQIWMDDRMIPWHEAKVHVLTHTLHYGLGVFEGIRCYQCEDGRSAVFRLGDHIKRLFGSAHILELDIPFSAERLELACVETIRANNLSECYIRPIVFIGAGDMGLHASSNPVCVAVIAWPWGSYLGEEGLKRGIRVKTSSFQRFHINTLMTKAKVVGHYVNSILASNEARRAGYDEALLLDTDGYVAEASWENIFIVRDGTIRTPPLTSILAGITRDSVIRVAQELGYSVMEERFTRDQVYLADEAFFTGTAAEVAPIRELDDRRIGLGKPGPVTLAIQDAYFKIVRGRDEKHLSWLAFI